MGRLNQIEFIQNIFKEIVWKRKTRISTDNILFVTLKMTPFSSKNFFMNQEKNQNTYPNKFRGFASN
jgi:hypothetical protein